MILLIHAQMRRYLKMVAFWKAAKPSLVQLHRRFTAASSLRYLQSCTSSRLYFFVWKLSSCAVCSHSNILIKTWNVKTELWLNKRNRINENFQTNKRGTMIQPPIHNPNQRMNKQLWHTNYISSQIKQKWNCFAWKLRHYVKPIKPPKHRHNYKIMSFYTVVQERNESMSALLQHNRLHYGVKFQQKYYQKRK